MVKNMAIEPEVKQVLDEHGGRIQKLENNMEIVLSKVGDLGTAFGRVENVVLSTQNSILTNYTNLAINNKTQNTKIILKVLGVIGLMVGSFMAARYGVNIK
jgi:hypothetical protein